MFRQKGAINKHYYGQPIQRLYSFLQMKCLRKTYLTYLKLATGNDMRKLDSHSTDEVLNKHYIYTTIIKKAISEMSIFGDSK